MTKTPRKERPLKVGHFIFTDDYWGIIEARKKAFSNGRVIGYYIRPVLTHIHDFDKRYRPTQKDQIYVKRKVLTGKNIIHPNIFLLKKMLAKDPNATWHHDNRNLRLFKSSLCQQIYLKGNKSSVIEYQHDWRELKEPLTYYLPATKDALFRILHRER